MAAQESSAHSRHVWVYKGARREEAYLYVPEAERFDEVPGDLLEAMGPLTLVIDMELTPARPLARAKAAEVLKCIAARGYYLQMPPLKAPRPARPH